MAAETLSVEAIVFACDLSSGGYLRLTLLTRDSGLLRAMRRVSSKEGSCGNSPDLFDVCAVELDRRSGRAWFVREYVPQRRHSGLGSRYEALQTAARWSRLVTANASSMETTDGVYALTVRFLDALDRGALPEAALLKTLFLFARDEGLPAREEWFRSLPAAQAELARNVLETPLDALQPDDSCRGAITGLADGIERWMCTSYYIAAPR